MKKIFTQLSILLSVGAMNAQTFWTNLNVPNSASYYAISHDGSKMYATNGNIGSGGQFFYKQGAAPFNSVAVTINSLTSVNNILCLANGNIVVTGQQAFTVPVVYRSVDDGTTWTQSSATLTGYNQSIIQDAAANVYVYNSVLGSAVLKSTDNGATFANASGTFQVKSLAVTGNTLFACGTNGGWNIWKSTDGAATWTLMPNNATQGNQSSVYATPNGNIYFGDYRSTDGGTTWVARTAPPSGSGIYAVDALNNIYVKDEPNSLFKSSDAGATYTNVVNGLNWSPTVSAQRKIATNDGKLYFSTIGAGTYSLYEHTSGAPSAIGENSGNEVSLSIYPVPANEKLIVSLKNSSDEVTSITITDLFGKEVYKSFTKSEGDLSVSVSDLSTGIYFLNVKTTQSSISTKMIISK